MLGRSVKGERTAVITPVLLFGLVGVYIVLQFTWWAWLLVDKDREVRILQEQLIAEGIVPVIPRLAVDRTVWMVAGEGGVFIVLLLLALWVIHRTVKHELGLARQQRDFLLAASHELRTPIAGMKLHLQTLERPTIDEAQRAGLQEHLRAEVERLRALTEKILLATRLDEPDILLSPEQVDVTELLRSIVASAEKSYGRDHTLIVDAPAGSPLRVDVDAFRSVANNLLENACKYAPPGTAVHVSWARKERTWELRVSDAGPGIPKAEKALIFRKFHRGGSEETRAAKGTGLGLYIVQRLMRAMGGGIDHGPGPNGGSIFVASFPAP